MISTKVKRKISDINKITAPNAANTSKSVARVQPRVQPRVNTKITTQDARRKLALKSQPQKRNVTPNLAHIDARRKILSKTKAAGASTSSDARLMLLQKKVPVPDGRLKITSNLPKQAQHVTLSVVKQGITAHIQKNTLQTVVTNKQKSILRTTGSTAVVKPIKHITFNTIEKDLPVKKPPSQLNLTRTVKNDVDTMIVGGVLKRTLNPKIVSDSVQILDQDLKFTISQPSPTKQPKLDDDFVITKPIYQRIKVTAPQLDAASESKNDKYHFNRKPNLDFESTGVEQLTIHKPLNTIKLKTDRNSATVKNRPVSGSMLRKQVTGQQQVLELPPSIDKSLSEITKPLEHNFGLTSLKFTQKVDGTVHKHIQKTNDKTASGPLKLYRPLKEHTVPIHLAKQPTGESSSRTLPHANSAVSANTAGVKHIPAKGILKAFPELPAQKELSEPDNLSPLQGYTIVVTNLHPVVTYDDVIELFNSVGPLKKAHMIKPGHATVVYKNKESAIAAVRRFHSRELDGMPMHVKLVTSLTATVSGSTDMSQEIKTLVANSEKSDSHLPTPSVNKDLINRALFKTGANTAPSKPVTFTVKI